MGKDYFNARARGRKVGLLAAYRGLGEAGMRIKPIVAHT